MKAAGTGKRELARTGTQQFSLLGVTWAEDAQALDGTAQVRTRSVETGEWTGWQDLDVDEAHPVDRAEPGAEDARGGSEPLWVGPSDGVEARVVAAGGTPSGGGSASAGLPKGLEINLVDPGVTAAEAKNKALDGSGSGSGMEAAAFVVEDASASPSSTSASPPPTTSTSPSESNSPSPSQSSSPSASQSPSPSPTPTATVPTAPPSTVHRPPIISRAQWGADESMVDDPAEYIDKVSAVFVHHTVGTNNYSCAESASLVRGIMAYHVQTEQWNDIGYNFLVDKCGRIFEGRAGGVDLPVRGAHTYGFNGDSTGIAVLGDFEGAAATATTPAKPAGRPTRATLESVARVAAWKLGQYGGNPTGKVTLTAGADTGVWDEGQQATLNTISGHRDGFATACPGKNLYAKLAEIRRFAASAGKNSAIPTADFNRDGTEDLVAGTPRVNLVTVVPGGLDGPVTASKRAFTQNSAGIPGTTETGDNFGYSTAWGDVNGDGYADLAIGSPGEDDTSGNADRGQVSVMYGPDLTRGFAYTTSGVTASGAKLGSTVTVGDFNADGKADVFSAGTGTGGNWNVRLTDGGYTSGRLTGATGSLAYLDAATGDFNRDGYADVALNYRDTGGIGRVVRFAGSATGLAKVGVISVKGGRSIAAGDVNGNGYDDIVIGQPIAAESSGVTAGQVTMVPGTSTGFTTTGMTTIHQNTTGVPGANESYDAMGASVSIGDYNADGYADVLAGVPNEDLIRSGVNQTNAGNAILIKGTSSGLTGSGAVSISQDTTGVPGATESGDAFGSSVSLADLSGYGRTDLTFGAQGEDAGNGVLTYVPSNSTGLGYSYTVMFGKGTLGLPTGARLGQTLAP
ncbi:FG-GAP-like repeat-containing protein [Streptomyces sp. DG2A-72]|uniref:FG-GAP-like repeat-containing protein n=1 Tax=Streptomyces sp. DG2A-72 TaxID=3051386 RepID=UPI00265BE2BA|nr:FG-GAP-like repeat-containing protein [Streptomyces sp. DG2A-72]MDO0935809.1 FG-GAP-like repeat-containing protein [Streptomyces sp. DG2A-72]